MLGSFGEGSGTFEQGCKSGRSLCEEAYRLSPMFGVEEKVVHDVQKMQSPSFSGGLLSCSTFDIVGLLWLLLLLLLRIGKGDQILDDGGRPRGRRDHIFQHPLLALLFRA